MQVNSRQSVRRQQARGGERKTSQESVHQALLSYLERDQTRSERGTAVSGYAVKEDLFADCVVKGLCQ